MALCAMPFLVLNMGGEMVYILEQRLKDQMIEDSKCEKGEQSRHDVKAVPPQPPPPGAP